ncbi:MAG: class I SAM-dependent methyltransferase [Flavobacteriales bacterium]|nr:class I SAM-dependent methyltransferase [Flavobacteriales bacterium]
MIIQRIKRKLFGTLPRIKRYHPRQLTAPQRKLEVVSAWKGLELIIEDLIDRYGVGRERCIEFGVEFGFSAVAFSSFFKEVVGVDTFTVDIHTRNKQDHYEATKTRLAPYSNIRLVRSDYRDFIKQDHGRFDFAHVDIVHNYKETFECGLWCAKNADMVVFHDTESFLEVRRAVRDIARATGYRALNYPLHHGLGILINPRLAER